MGTWGPGILEDDSAQDTYQSYLDQYNLGREPAEIRQWFERQFPWMKTGDQLDNVPFWVGLAQAQWECQALDAEVLSCVQRIVVEDVDADNWEDEYAARKKELVKFLKKIAKAKSAPRKRVKPRDFALHFGKGDLLAFRYPDGLYGAVICLDGDKTRQKRPLALLAPTRIHQKASPTSEEVAATHLLTSADDFPSPYLTNYMLFDRESSDGCQQLSVVGHIEVERSFATRLYPISAAWGMHRFGTSSFAREADNSQVPVHLTLPVREFVKKRPGEMGVFAELYVQAFF